MVQESRGCVVSVTTEAQFMSSSPDVNSVSSCGSKSHPWRLEAAAGQRINISLLDFTDRRLRDRVTCRQYGYVLEKSNKRNVSVCGGGGAELRQSHVYISDTNNVEIVTTPPRLALENENVFLIRVEGRYASIIHSYISYVVFADASGYANFRWSTIAHDCSVRTKRLS